MDLYFLKYTLVLSRIYFTDKNFIFMKFTCVNKFVSLIPLRDLTIDARISAVSSINWFCSWRVNLNAERGRISRFVLHDEVDRLVDFKRSSENFEVSLG